MSAKNHNTGKNTLLSKLLGRKRKAARESSRPANRRSRQLQMEGLENREMFAVSSIYLSGGAIQVFSDNNATKITVSQIGSNYRISEQGSNRFWDHAMSAVNRVDFVGGNGNDSFVNKVPTLPTRAWGQGGNDYLEGYSAVDEFYGGDGNDELLGYGGNDILVGGAHNDYILGMGGADRIWGEGGTDHLDGGSDWDRIWGGDQDDTLLGGTGDDELYGDNGNDQLNGQAGADKLWGYADNDVLISLDGGINNDTLDSGTGFDTMWADGGTGFMAAFSDQVVSPTSLDMVHRITSFANGADLTLDGDNISDPTDTGVKYRFTNTINVNNTRGFNPLFSNTITVSGPGGTPFVLAGGPTSSDVNQGNSQNCWLLTGLGAIANKSQNLIRQNVVDFNDGTFGVRLGNTYYRVDSELPVLPSFSGSPSMTPRFAQLGAQGSMWLAVIEKAFAHYRGSNTYASLANGSPTEVYSAFRMKNVASYNFTSIYGNAGALGQDLYNRSISGFALVVGANGHAFTVESFVRTASGAVTHLVLRNPWGTDSLSSFPAFASANGGSSSTDGLFTVTVAQLFSSGGTIRWGQV